MTTHSDSPVTLTGDPSPDAMPWRLARGDRYGDATANLAPVLAPDVPVYAETLADVEPFPGVVR